MPYKNPADAKARAVRYYLKTRLSQKPYAGGTTHPHIGFPQTARQRGHKRDLKVRRQFSVFIRNLKESFPCMDCGIFYPSAVMEYDHVRGIKLFNISSMSTLSFSQICAEIAKCDLVCANCHRIRHITRSNFP